MNPVQVTGSDAPADRRAIEAQTPQLGIRRNSVLLARKPSHLPLPRKWAVIVSLSDTFTAHPGRIERNV
jgi:hypothetical protein